MRIERIEVQHFRGFPAHYKFELGKPGKNLLIYGENGSGKSSLFKALKGFFEATPTTNLASQQNCFVGEPEPLVKLDIAAYDEAGDRLPNSAVYEWSVNSSPGSESLIQTANKTKGCLDYKALLETHYVHRDKDLVEVFDLLINTILNHVENPISRKPLGQEFKEIAADKRKHMGYGYKDSYQNRIDQFNQGFATILEQLTTSGNSLLKGFFADTKLSIQVGKKLVFSGTGIKKHLEKPTVYLTIEFAGKPLIKAHEFLNEARLSAVAIALYLGTLLLVPASDLRVLVLDDLLIGIDMSNRVAVLKVLLDRFPDWQIILLTHDRVWYETVRMRTQHSNSWYCGTLRAKTGTNGNPMPWWKGPGEGWDTNLDIAKLHLDADDIRAAGVYARTAFEEKLKRFCEDHRVPVRYAADMAALKSDDFWRAVLDWTKQKGKEHEFSSLVSQVETSRKLILNPLSHEHPINLVVAEIEQAIAVVRLMDETLRNLFPKKHSEGVPADA
jgi:energy-coupling factor transporter ATP-binding protein EcfA2